MTTEELQWTPGQYKPHPELHDLRGAVTGPRGYKLRNKKRGRDEADLDEQPRNEQVSKRPWKEARDKRHKGGKPTSWEKKMEMKAQTKAYREHKEAAISEYKAKCKDVADKRKAAASRKEENRKKSEVVQVIKNPATLKKMMKNKKMKNKLVTRDTN